MKDIDIVRLRVALRELLKRSREQRQLYRVLCVLLSAQLGNKPVGGLLGENTRTLARWRARFEARGAEGLGEDTSPGRPPLLGPEQMKAVLDDLHKPPYVFGFRQDQWLGKLLKRHIQKRYDIDISLRQCQRLLREAQSMHCKRAERADRQVPSQAVAQTDDAEQAETEIRPQTRDLDTA